MAKIQTAEPVKPARNPWVWIGWTLLILVIALPAFLIAAVFAVGIASLAGAEKTAFDGNVAVIPITGLILTQSEESGFFEETRSSTDIVDLINEAAEDDDILAIVLEIDSPGGSPVASDEIAKAVKNAGKPTVAVIREVGASGAYWIASATDHIIANRMSVTGSIGVIGSYLEYADLLTRYNITYRRLVSGKYKDIESPYREMSEEEQKLVQKQLDTLHAIFIDEVATNRELPRDKVQELANGYIYLGTEALQLGLIDQLGGMEDADAFLEAELGTDVEFVDFTPEPSLADIFLGRTGVLAERVGTGIGKTIASGNSGPKYLLAD